MTPKLLCDVMSSIFERTQVELISGWLIVGAKQGKKEPFDRLLRTRKAPRTLCADEFEINHVQMGNDAIICFAVADGVGDAPYADIGAREAVRVAVNALADECESRHISRVELERVLHSVHRHLINHSVQRNIDPSDLATTLAVGALDTTDARLVVAGIGDAFFVAQRNERTWSFPPLDNFEPNAGTYSIVDPRWKEIARYEDCPFQPQTVIAFTDGLRHVMFKVDRASAQQSTIPHVDAIQVFRQAIMQSDNASRGRAVAALLGVSGDRKLMEDDRTVLILQNLVMPEQVVRHPLAQEFPRPHPPPPPPPPPPPGRTSPNNGRPLERQQTKSIRPERLVAFGWLRFRGRLHFGTTESKLSMLIALTSSTLALLLLSFVVDIASARHTIATKLHEWAESVRHGTPAVQRVPVAQPGSSEPAAHSEQPKK
jgi:hypothetical protein